MGLKTFVYDCQAAAWHKCSKTRRYVWFFFVCLWSHFVI